MRKPLPSLKVLSECLLYDRITGALVWRRSLSPTAQAGATAGTTTSSGYLAVAINGQKYQAHRIAWKMVVGSDPVDDIDHINGDRRDNRLSNLRAATKSQNNANSRVQRNSASGLKGVRKSPSSPNRWEASIRRNGKNQYLGLFKSPELAHQAYMTAAKEFFGEFAVDRDRAAPSELTPALIPPPPNTEH